MDTASTVFKALDALAILAGRREGVRLPELIQALNQPRSNVVRLLGTLSGYGLVARDGRRWQATRAFHEWNAPPDRHTNFRRRYRPVLAAIAAGTGELVLLGLHEGNGIVHLDYIESDHRIRVAPAPGTRHNLRHNALGKLALSRRPDLAASFPERRFQKELEQIRETGVAWNREETVRGMIAMAMPGFSNQPTEAMLAVAWPTVRFTEHAARHARNVIKRALTAASSG